jgi:hypothetical protein
LNVIGVAGPIILNLKADGYAIAIPEYTGNSSSQAGQASIGGIAKQLYNQGARAVIECKGSRLKSGWRRWIEG